MNKPESILITGATGAIGSALAREYAAPGVQLILHGRNPVLLDQLAVACRQQGARVETCTLDLRDVASVHRWAGHLAATMPPDLLIANAGMNISIGSRGEGECWEGSEALLAINLRSTVALVDGLLPAMRAKGRGQIALISSLAGYFGLPVTPSYCASKAALKAYGEAWRGWLAGENIEVNVVMPGYITSAMCQAMPGPKLFVWPPQKAARAIRRGLEKNQARISFPFPLNLGTWALAVLPAQLSQFIVRFMGYHV
ncbi:MAG: SDR family NAD(P)-dependent oxidoreductase [Magnetococcales bacterium]|nr:SDR family NAD(P)-dependent oxidoreductase [Magnetococcales bacterium]NGZ28988.1 SDR family NAD(P)-dependent oxidoreductase [Magnetococcales bacterium]